MSESANALPESVTVHLRFPVTDLAVITFDDPRHSVNVLSRSVLSELNVALDQVAATANLRGLIITSAKPKNLLAGADLKELAARNQTHRAEVELYCQTGRRIFQRLHQLPIPTIVAWSGLALGGGAELALWADFRIVSNEPTTALGFPEVKIGLIPGWGGTFTATRWAGLGNAMELVCGGENLDAARAKALGLVDDVVPANDLLATAERWLELARQNQLWQRQRARLDTPPQISPADLQFMHSIAAARIQKQSGGHYPAPQIALDVLTQTALSDADAACDRAATEMAALVGTPVNRALLNLFFAREQNKKDSGLDHATTNKPQSIQKVGVIGAGIMGYSISAVNLKHGKQIVLHDANAEALQTGRQRALDEAAWDKSLRGPNPVRVQALAEQLTTLSEPVNWQHCDLVIEAVVENLDIKRGILQRVEEQLPPTSFLASNTSTIRIAKLAEPLQRPENFCGLHFFNPVRKMPLCEVIRGPQTSDATVLATVAYAKSIGKTPIVVNDGPGFLVNRLLSPYLNEAIALLHQGYHWSEIDAAAVAFGMPIGPFAIYDMVGMDTALFAGRVMWEAFPERMLLSPVLVDLYKAGRMGQKSGAGFFRYQPNSEQPLPDPAADQLLSKHLEPIIGARLTTEDLQWRLLLPMLFEAARVLESHVVRQVHDIDLGVVLGLGFPAFRGGILRWADQVGLAKVQHEAAKYANLGERWQLPTLLKNMLDTGKKFYAES